MLSSLTFCIAFTNSCERVNLISQADSLEISVVGPLGRGVDILLCPPPDELSQRLIRHLIFCPIPSFTPSEGAEDLCLMAGAPWLYSLLRKLHCHDKGDASPILITIDRGCRGQCVSSCTQKCKYTTEITSGSRKAQLRVLAKHTRRQSSCSWLTKVAVLLI